MSEVATIRLTKEELWELMNNFSASFQSGIADNELADRVAKKLADAYERMTKK